MHCGREDQQPDPLIVATEGAEHAPAYRGLAYIVFEDLDLTPFGERIPQFSVEVFRSPDVARGNGAAFAPLPRDLIEAVALSPGSGEFSLATEPVRRVLDPGVSVAENVNSVDGRPDLIVALDQLKEAAPHCGSVSLVVSWFGDDLRCGRCTIAPAVEARDKRTEPAAWRVSGVERSEAKLVGETADGRPVYGGTPSDRSVVQAIEEMKRRGLRVMFYPFILMDIPAGSGLPDPWGADEQPAYPWRGRITLDHAPGRDGGTDQTAAAAEQVARFFGEAQPGDFWVEGESIAYAGPPEWSLRRFVLHYAHLCARAGGVDAFCIASELRGLTTIRSARATYPAVAALRALAADVRGILGPQVKLTYAADWSEYFGHHPDDASQDAIFHLDPLWADPNIDAVGIDNYAPLTDWRDGHAHLDAQDAASIHDLDYLRSRIEGGEGFDWHYASAQDRIEQRRTPIVDGAYGEDWVFRFKDVRSWWANAHHDRIGGLRRAEPTDWVPGSKPIWFTEIGCAAIDKGANQPNLFLDPKSSESRLPAFSSGARDDHMQSRFVQAVLGYWRDEAMNPAAALYEGRMIETAQTHLWTWDARPWPDFPERLSVWSDGANHALGHWANGRLGSADLAEIVAELCAASGLDGVDVSGLQGCVTGYAFEAGLTARQALQPLMLAYAFDALESAGRLKFVMRDAAPATDVDPDALGAPAGDDRPPGVVRRARAPALDAPLAIRLRYPNADDEYAVAAVEARDPTMGAGRVNSVETAVVMDDAQACALVCGQLAEAETAREKAMFALPPSLMRHEPGDVVSLGGSLYRIDAVAAAGAHEVTATRIDRNAKAAASVSTMRRKTPTATPARAPMAVFVMDAPALFGSQTANAPLVAAFADPWPGGAAVYSSPSGDAWRLDGVIGRPCVIGELIAPLPAGKPGRWMRTNAHVRLYGGALASLDAQSVLAGGNLAAVKAPGGSLWELMQFQTAELVGPRTYRLSPLLRGQAGCERLAAETLPEGSAFVLLDGAAQRFDAGPQERGLPRVFRIGPQQLRFDDPSFVVVEACVEGVGTRPLAPAHLRVRDVEGGGWRISWIRRSRFDADTWVDPEPPREQAAELYRLRVNVDGQTRFEAETSAATFFLSASEALSLGVAARFEVHVAQLSDRNLAGAEARVTINV